MEFEPPDLATSLATEPLAGFIGAGQPALIASGDPARVVWANAAAHVLLDRAPANRGLDGDAGVLAEHPEIRKILRAAVRLRPGGPALMQRVRFAFGRDSFVVTVRCWRLAGERPLIVIAIPDAPAQVVRPPQIAQAGRAACEPARPEAEPAPLTGDAPRRGNVRFVWRTDGDDILQSVDAVVCQLMGWDASALLGKRIDDLVSMLDLIPAEPLRAALATRATWSRLQVSWPFPALGKRAPVVLGGLPARDAVQAFDGFRGFGVIHLDDAVEMSAPALLAPPSLQAPEIPQMADAHEAPHVTDTPQVPDASQTPSETIEPSDEPVVAADERAHAAPSGDDDRAGPPESIALGEPAAEPLETPEAPRAEARTPAGDECVEQDDASLRDEERPAMADEREERSARSSFMVGAGNVVPLRFVPREAAPAPPAPVMNEDIVSGAEIRPPDARRDSEAPEAVTVDEPEHAPPSSDPAPLPDDGDISLSDPLTEGARDDGNAPAEPELPEREPPVAVAPSADVRPLWQEGQGGRADGMIALSPAERDAFREIARALGARSHEDVQERSHSPHLTSEGPSDGDGLPPALVAAREAGAIGPEHATVADAGAGAHAGIAAPVVECDQTASPSAAPDDRQRAELLDRIGLALLVQQSEETAYANDALLDLLDYDSFEDFRAAGAIAHTFRGRDPEALVREAGGGAIPALTRGGDVMALRGRVQTISWNNAPASLYTFHKDEREEVAAKLRAMELDLRKREVETRELHAILDTATDGVALLDAEGRILSLNRAGQALFGYDENEVAGEPFVTLFCLESQDAARKYFEGLQSGDVRSVLNDGREVYGRASQGGAIPVFVTIGRIQPSPNPKYCAVLRDVTQWKKAERELRDARRAAEAASAMKSDFLAKISHEVRTPLNAILGFAEVIMHERFGPVGNERYKDYLKDIHASGMHVMSLINDLLDLSKIEAGKLDLDFSSVNVNKIVNECVSMMQSQALNERVVLRLSLAPRLPNVVADERSLRQIVLNVLSNAVKFNEPGGQVIVSTALTEAGHAVLRIRDTGIGMSEKDVETALEPFRQIATSRASRGTGLGLPLTKALVEANRAMFSIKSRKGEGTLVEVAFPPTRVLAE